MSSLRDQLERFHGAVTGRGLDGARHLVERGEIDELERLRVYEYAYVARIGSVLVHDYPKLAHIVGDTQLRAWTAEYLRAHRPSNFSLREVGAHLAHWLAHRDMHDGPVARPMPIAVSRSDGYRARDAHRESDPDRESDVGTQVLADLARLERARTEVFDGPDATPLTREHLATMQDPAEFPALPLRLVPSSRVVSMRTNADDLWDAIENASPATRPVECERVVLVWRRELTVIHRTLDADEARIVPTMIEGTSFGAACDLLDEETAAERAIELLLRWLDAQILRR